MARLERIAQIETPDSAPRYELRVRRHGPAGSEYEIWQMPATATPQLTSALRLAGLRGRNLELVEHRVLKRLSQSGVKPVQSVDIRKRGYALNEDLALTLGLLFRTLAPMRSRDNMRAVAEGIEVMGREEAAYWLGMAMHRKHPRRGADGAAVPADGTETMSGQAGMQTTRSGDIMDAQQHQTRHAIRTTGAQSRPGRRRVRNLADTGVSDTAGDPAIRNCRASGSRNLGLVGAPCTSSVWQQAGIKPGAGTDNKNAVTRTIILGGSHADLEPEISSLGVVLLGTSTRRFSRRLGSLYTSLLPKNAADKRASYRSPIAKCRPCFPRSGFTSMSRPTVLQLEYPAGAAYSCARPRGACVQGTSASYAP